MKQVGTPTNYMMEFKKLSVKLDDVSIGRLVLLFTNVLVESLKGLVKSYKPTTLKDAMRFPRGLQNVLPRTRFAAKPNFKFEKKPWQRDAPDKKPLKRDST